MTARPPGPASRPGIAPVGGSPRVRHGLRVARDEVGFVTHPVTRVHYAPGQVDAFVDEAVARVPAADLVEQAARHRDRALPHERDVTGPAGRRGGAGGGPPAP